MFYNAKEKKLNLYNMQIDTISFGRGKKKLIMIQGLNTRGIKGASVSLAYMYRLFAKEYTVYLFDRRPNISDGMVGAREQSNMISSARKLHQMIPGSKLIIKDKLYHGEYSINHPAEYAEYINSL